ncbi:IS3 family transposase [Polynucleobacter paneuropaeus]|uniref:IS3 family transposase n=1 Tax=Polynucleobacter sp. JS-Fieb-80-E5 TaxID=2081050 RepID=UPI001C0C4AA2|nr:IS3 family transposase [Polynucleobacter sp. JS-Fieb-80-E5]MBU3618190.1 IS3 family transposase [Polynucleobacter sp. JS-Fieb-80-E5]QWD05286.1 IS3 family transposase [Polynucleobacter paneuropaeus]
MAKGQRLKPEQIVTLLRQIDVLTTNGKTLAQACKEVGTVEQSYYRWRKIYGGMKVDQARKYKDLELENTRLKKLVADLSLREVMLKEVIKGKLLSPAKRKTAAQVLLQKYSTSERLACELVGLSRAAYRYMPLPKDDEEPLRAEVIRMASTYGRYGYRFIASMMRNVGWGQATTARVARIWRQEGLKIPQRQPPRGRLWLSDGSCIRLRATAPNHVWSYDFVFIRDAYGGKIRMLTMIDEFTRKCLTIHCARRIGSIQVIEQLANAMITHGIPEHIRSDNGPEFIAKELRSWLSGIGVKTAYIEPGSPWENGFCESFNGTFRDNLLDGEIFYSLKEAQIIVGEWVKHYNQVRPHSALGYRPPAPQTQVPKLLQNQPMLLQ